MKQSTQNGMANTQAVLAQSLVNLSVDARQNHPDLESTKRALRLQRSRFMPRDPQNLQELLIAGEQATTGGAAGDRFLLRDYVDAAERVIVFATDENLRRLCAADVWHIDGNFSMAPILFAQVYVILARVSGVILPVVFALLQRKTQTSYEHLFRILSESCTDLRLPPLGPDRVILDFEAVSINAITAVLGAGIRIQGCFFHLCQSTYRKVQRLGLMHMYDNEREFKIFVRMLDALAFLPTAQVNAGMTYLRGTMSPEAAPIVDYFDSTYVSGSFRRIAGQNQLQMRMRRIPPTFAPALWNVHQITVNGDARTNNVMEGWNHKLRHLVGHQHPTVWKLIKCLQMEQAYTETILAQLDVGHIPPRMRTRRIYLRLQLRLQRLCMDFVGGERDIPNFLRSVAICLSHI